MEPSPAATDRTALICGIGGQDGAYLAAHLLELGYAVVGTSRDAQASSFESLARLGIRDRVTVESMTLVDFRSTMQAISRHEPDEIYNLAGQTSVGLSFSQPVETFESIVIGTVNLLEAIRILGRPIRLYNAGSSEMFGNTGTEPAGEQTVLRPCSPYGIAKATSFWQVAQYRQAYGIAACTGILFNHESPLRPERFVTQKIIQGVKAIAEGRQAKLQLGNLDIWRDWGWAPEYVEAMHKMLQPVQPHDYVIASGMSHSLREFVGAAFEDAGLDSQDQLEIVSSLMRPSDLRYSAMDPSKIAGELGWRSEVKLPEIVQKMSSDTLH
jgi:GDPmannose 4,6-dehydratase